MNDMLPPPPSDPVPHWLLAQGPGVDLMYWRGGLGYSMFGEGHGGDFDEFWQLGDCRCGGHLTGGAAAVSGEDGATMTSDFSLDCWGWTHRNGHWV